MSNLDENSIFDVLKNMQLGSNDSKEVAYNMTMGNLTFFARVFYSKGVDARRNADILAIIKTGKEPNEIINAVKAVMDEDK